MHGENQKRRKKTKYSGWASYGGRVRYGTSVLILTITPERDKVLNYLFVFRGMINHSIRKTILIGARYCAIS